MEEKEIIVLSATGEGHSYLIDKVFKDASLVLISSETTKLPLKPYFTEIPVIQPIKSGQEKRRERRKRK